MMKHKIKRKMEDDLIDACKNGHLDMVKYLLTSPELEEHADIHVDDDYGFRLACANGHLEVVKYLLTSKDLQEHTDIHVGMDAGFRRACMNGHFEIVKYLLTSPELKEYADIHAKDDFGLLYACNYGHRNIVEFFINETSEYSADNIKCIETDQQLSITKEEVIEMIKTRDLKNQLYDEIRFKNNEKVKSRPII